MDDPVKQVKPDYSKAMIEILPAGNLSGKPFSYKPISKYLNFVMEIGWSAEKGFPAGAMRWSSDRTWDIFQEFVNQQTSKQFRQQTLQ